MSLIGYVLDRVVHGEKYWRVTLITREFGVRACLVRISLGAKNKQICVPDLFDEVEIVLPSSKAGLASDLVVAKEYRVLQKSKGISRDYDVLIYASQWTYVLAKNQFSADFAGTLYELAVKVLNVFSEKPLPAATYFKGLWMLVKMAGYPIKEDWFENLAYDEREAATQLLTTPLESLQMDGRMLKHIVSRLERWLTYTHQFRFNDGAGT